MGQVFGLATTRIQDRDRIWQFQETNVAFLVRKLTLPNEPTDEPSTAEEMSQISAIVGRAVLFSKADDTTFDRLSPSTICAASTFTPHEIRLKPADLFDLTFWADSIGPAASPFSG